MSLQGGDREFGHGDQITVVYDDTTDAVGGEAVKVTGRASTGDHVTVELAGDGERSDAIVADSATQGDAIQVVEHGLVWARVQDDPTDGSDVVAGDTVGEGANGVLDDDETDYRVYEGEAVDEESGETIALIRYEN